MEKLAVRAITAIDPLPSMRKASFSTAMLSTTPHIGHHLRIKFYNSYNESQAAPKSVDLSINPLSMRHPWLKVPITNAPFLNAKDLLTRYVAVLIHQIQIQRTSHKFSFLILWFLIKELSNRSPLQDV
jgi:hypothetical protein